MSFVQRRTTRRWSRNLRIALLIILTVIVLLSAWVGVRASLARDALLGAVPVANRIGSQVLVDGSQIGPDLSILQDRAQTAAKLTSDPVWRGAELVPALGANLKAFREAAGVIEQLASEALPPVHDLAGSFSTDSLTPVGGGIDLEIFREAQPSLGQAREALENADAAASQIDTASTIPQIGSAVDQIVELVSRAKGIVDGLDLAASLLPTLLGGDEPRSYLLLSLNNAELRSTGGLPGAIAVISAHDGLVTLGETASATELGEFDDPVLPLTSAESVLYGEALGTWMHDVNLTPDFSRSGELARAMWLERTGTAVDGVLSIDPVALGYLLGATGVRSDSHGRERCSDFDERRLFAVLGSCGSGRVLCRSDRKNFRGYDERIGGRRQISPSVGACC
jgi:hypothetical protein